MLKIDSRSKITINMREGNSMNYTFEKLRDIIECFDPCMDNYLYVYDIIQDLYFISERAKKRFALSSNFIGFSLLNCLEFFVFRKMKSSSTINHPLCGCESNVIQKKLPFRVQ